MACIVGDQDLRVQISKGSVVHAAAKKKFGDFTKIEYTSEGRREVYVEPEILVAPTCKRFSRENFADYLVDNTTEITCKNCLKLMGLSENKQTNRFVVFNTETEEYLKNAKHSCNNWSDSIYDAFFFKRKHTAEDRCKQYHYVKDGRILTAEERLSGIKGLLTKMPDPKLVVRKVTITVDKNS